MTDNMGPITAEDIRGRYPSVLWFQFLGFGNHIPGRFSLIELFILY